MKILKFFLCAAVILTLASCSSDDDGGPVALELTNATLEGTYNITFLEGSSETTVIQNGTTVVVQTQTFVGDTFTNAVFTFNSDGTYSISGDYRLTTTTTITGVAPETESQIVPLDEDGTFSVSTASRTITLDGDEVLDVSLFTATNLNVTGSYSESDQGATEVGEYEYRLQRQN